METIFTLDRSIMCFRLKSLPYVIGRRHLVSWSLQSVSSVLHLFGLFLGYCPKTKMLSSAGQFNQTS